VEGTTSRAPYRTPRLLTFGDVNELTNSLNVAGKNSDGGMGTVNKT
jgi:hypothetical protein